MRVYAKERVSHLQPKKEKKKSKTKQGNISTIRTKLRLSNVHVCFGANTEVHVLFVKTTSFLI